jgi:hypothetical protein
MKNQLLVKNVLITIITFLFFLSFDGGYDDHHHPQRSIVVDSKKTPELTSTALRIHKVYTQQPPHNTQLYDILQVNPNSTQAQITKSYRNLSRKYHPDKKVTSADSRDDDRQKLLLQQIQRAYDVLSNDSTRLFYHKYGILDPNLAALLLMGPTVHPKFFAQKMASQSSSSSSSSLPSSSAEALLPFETLDKELLELMGYDDESIAVDRNGSDHCTSSDNGNIPFNSDLEDQRVRTIAAYLVEQIRPLVEGRVDARVYAHMVAQKCDRWKGLPLGAQIIRCVGRAYRHTGQDFLRQYNSQTYNKKSKLHHLQADFSVKVRQNWRSAKHLLTAVATSGRLAITEKMWKKNDNSSAQPSKAHQPPPECIEYQDDNDEEDSESFLPFRIDDTMDQILDTLEEERKQNERDRTQHTLLQALQVEALWKVCKIDLDKVVRRACMMILSGEYFFFPSNQSSNPIIRDRSIVGWISSSTGKAIDAEVAKLRAAESMMMIGEIMVQQSKRGTSWKD